MSKNCSALVLDFGGVISRTLFETHDHTEKALGLTSGTLTWRGPFDPSGDPVWRSMQNGEISERDYWSHRMAETGDLVCEKWTKFPQFISRVRGDDPAAVIRPEAIDAITRAHKSNIRLAILSNELDLFYGKEFKERLPFLDDFDTIIDATYTGILKPDPRAYKAVTDALGLTPSDCVFVDDQLKNIRGGKKFGMKCVHFQVTDPQASYREALQLLGLE